MKLSRPVDTIVKSDVPDEIYNRDMLLIMAVRFLEKQYGEGV